jgi:gliding motility-associated-like protein
MFKLYTSAILLLLTQVLFAQQPVLQWAKAFVTSTYITSNSNGRAIGVDGQGNVYSAGFLHNTIDMDPGPAMFPLSGTSHGEYGIYISKLDPDGNFVWAKQIPTLVEFGDIELKVDKDGNVYLASNLPDPADMDPGPGVQIMTPIGAKDAFVVKLDTDGNLVWAKQFGGPGDTVPQANVLVIDKDNNVIICGLFNNTVDFDPGPGTYNITSTAHIQAYVVKLNNNGDFIWAKQLGNSPIVYSGSAIVDVNCDKNGNIYTMGAFSGTCDFDPGSAVHNLTSGSIRDGFVAKWTPGGDFIWAKGIKNVATEYNNHMYPRAIDFDNMNNVIVAGSFYGTFDFDPGTASHNIVGNGYDCYILKLTEQGDFVWVKIISGNGYEAAHDFMVGADNNLYIIGEFGPTVDFDPGPGDHTVTFPNYGASAVIKLTNNGDFIYATAFPGTSGSTFFRRMEMDPSLNIYITGTVSGSIDFDPGPGVYTLNANASAAPLVLKLGPCANRTTSTLAINACDSYTLNNTTFNTSGTYIQTIPNTQGCDSIITLQLTINKKSTQQTKTICEGESFFAGGSDQTISGTYVDVLRTVLGCDSVVTTILTVNPKPLPNLGPDKNLCNNTQLNVAPGIFTSYQWQDMTTAGSLTIKEPGKYWVKVTNSFNCTATDTLTIAMMLPTPSNFLKTADSVCNYESLEISPLNNYTSYQWSTGATTKNIKVEKPGNWWLKVTDINGCSGADTITVFDKKCMWGFYAPSAFSPNGDRKNDEFRPLLFGKVKQYRFAVYNRWGTLIFQTADPYKGWDGRIGGTAQPNGVFVWTCSYQLEGAPPKTEKGAVTLIR